MNQARTSTTVLERCFQVAVALIALAGTGSLGLPAPAEAGSGVLLPAGSTITLAPGETSSPEGRVALTDFSDKMTATKPMAGDDRTLSPYFFIPGGDSSTDRLPLKATSADVAIAGVIADVTVTQVYSNEGDHPIEAVYVFPGSTRAAVYGMKMTIGERTIVAQIQKRAEAREAYETAKAQGKSASLLEQERPNVFQMNVANILPGDEIRVELRYTELLVPTAGIYEFVYPTVVGPRYSNTPAEGAPDTERWVQNPYLTEGQKPTYAFDITATLDAGMPIQEMAVPTHKVHIQYESASRAVLTLDESEQSGGNRDVILRYRLAGNRVQSGLLLYQGEKENFFLLINQPPARVEDDLVVLREYVFIVDVSGSMSGYPLNISKKLLKDLIGRLSPEERFNVILFAGRSVTMAPRSVPATKENIRKAINVIDHQRGGGGTELLPALQRAFDMPSAEGFSRSIVVITDGYVSIETKAFDLIRQRLGDANLFAFGIGSSVNRYLIEGMARVGLGEPFVVTEPGAAPATAEAFRTYIQNPVLTDIEVAFDGFEAYDVEPPSIPDVLAERPVIVFGKWRGTARGTITVSGFAGRAAYERTFDVGEFAPMPSNAALRYLWARHRIATLGDYNQLQESGQRVEEITDLGLDYHLLTAYTSFVAIDSLVRTDGDASETVVQPLPLPEGVSNAAVGGSLGGGGMGAVQTTAVRRSMRGTSHGRTKRKVSPAAPQVSTELAPVPAMDELASGYASSQVGKSVENEDDDSEGRAEAKKETSGERKDVAFDSGVEVEIDTLRVKGALGEADVRAFLEAHAASLEACYASALGRNPESRGKLTLTIVLGKDGKVVSVSPTRHDGDLGDDTMLACWTSRVERWVFPSGSGETTIEVTWTLAP